MSDIRYNQWLHNSGTGGVSQDAGGNIGIGTTAPLIPVGAGNTAILNVGVVTCNSIEVTGNVSVGGTLTYQDVTNIDSVGVITARSDIRGSRNLKIAGISTFVDNVTIVKSSGPLLELTTNTGANDATLRLSEGATGSTSNGGGMFYSGADNKLHITCGTNSTTKRITILRDDGKIGVGTVTPTSKLEVWNGSNIEVLRLKDTHFNKYLTIRGGGSPNRMVIDSYEGGGGGADIDLASNGSTKVRITSTGKVSIGDAATHTYSAHSEGDDLVVGGAGWRGMTIYGEGGGSVIQFADNADNRVGQILYNHGDNSMLFRTNGNQNRLIITSTGQLQATGAADVRLTLGSSGTAGTNDSVHVRADSADLKFMAASGGTTIFETNGNETLRIKSTGEVHISDRNSANAGEHILQGGAFGIRMQDTGGYNRWNIERNYGGWQANPIVHLSAQGRIGVNVADPKSQLHLYGPSDLRIGSLYGGVALLALQVSYASGYTGTHFIFEITDQASYSFEGSHIVHGQGGSSYGIECTVVRMQASREAGATDSGDTWRNGTVKYNNEFWAHGQVGLNPGAGTFSFAYDDAATTTTSNQKIAFSASGQSVGVWAKLSGVFTWATTSTNGRVKIKDKDGNVLWDSNP